MDEALLNDNQRRHLATFLHLLAKDLTGLRHASLPQPVLQQLDSTIASIHRLVDAFGLPEIEESSPTRRARVVALALAAEMHDLRAHGLRRYGGVDPRLAERLDPLVDQLQADLYALAGAAGGESG